MSSIVVDPTKETSVQFKRRPLFSYRYAYARSADSQTTGDTGQDFLTFHEDQQKIIFALCDGVSQSFFGDLAARYLGQALIKWLNSAVPDDPNAFCQALNKHLAALTQTANRLVNEFVIPGDIPPMLQEVLEQKRALGSESTFICGRIDLPGDGLPNGRLLLAWMGDSRLRLWGNGQEQSQILGDTFRTNQRWSTRNGPIGGTPNCFTSSLSGLNRIVVYSDGLTALDSYKTLPDNTAVDRLITHSQSQPQSDDISFLDIVLSQARKEVTAVVLPPERVMAAARDGRIRVAWRPVTGATAYQVRASTASGSETWQTMKMEWQSPTQLPPGNYSVQVRAIQGISYSEWSQPQPVEIVAAGIPTPTPARPSRSPASLALVLIPVFCLALICAFLVIWPNSPIRSFLASPTPTPTLTPTQTILTPTLVETGTAEIIPSPTQPPTATPTPSPEPTATLTPIPTATATATATESVTITITITATQTITLTPTIELLPETTLTPETTIISPIETPTDLPNIPIPQN